VTFPSWRRPLYWRQSDVARRARNRPKSEERRNSRNGEKEESRNEELGVRCRSNFVAPVRALGRLFWGRDALVAWVDQFSNKRKPRTRRGRRVPKNEIGRAIPERATSTKPTQTGQSKINAGSGLPTIGGGLQALSEKPRFGARPSGKLLSGALRFHPSHRMADERCAIVEL
jgi:hypothetical protein